MLKPQATYAETYDAFRWSVPEFYNIGVDVSDRPAQAAPNAPAIIDVAQDGTVTTTSFDVLQRRSNQCANALSRLAKTGERIGVLLPQRLETALAHIAALKMGAVSVPLFTLFGPDALQYRLADAGVRVVITDATGAEKLEQIRADLPDLEHVVCVDDWPGTLLFDALCAAERDAFEAAKTRADDPALLIYTSGTTGQPKGALHGHRVLLGHLPGVEMSHDFLPQPGDKLWTPADWAWIGGLLDVLLPGLHHGVPIVAHRFVKFDGAAAFDFLETHGIRNAFLPPTALKMMRAAGARHVPMRSVASGGETLGAELLSWGKTSFGVTINEFYGQTECNMIVSSCAVLDAPEPGVMGWPVPGHTVAVIDPEGQPLPEGIEGDIAVAAPDPVMFLRYWNNEPATTAKFRRAADGTRWLLTGDRGQATDAGRIRYKGREDDVITSSGYRIGPAEIEDCLITHPAVAMAGVIGTPDELRGEVVTAFVVLSEGATGSAAMAEDISRHVKTRLAAHEAPRRVHFLEALPMTTTGKIIRNALRALAETL